MSVLEPTTEEENAVKQAIKLVIMEAVTGLSGLGFIAWYDWRLAVGSFLVLWSVNIHRTMQK